MKVELIAALTTAGLGISGSAFIGYLQANSEARESIVRLSTVAEAISGQLGDLTEQMKKNRQTVHELMVDHNARLRVLESRR